MNLKHGCGFSRFTQRGGFVSVIRTLLFLSYFHYLFVSLKEGNANQLQPAILLFAMTEHVATFFRRFSHPTTSDMRPAKDPPVSHHSLPTHPHSPTFVMSSHSSSTSSRSEELEPVSAFGPPSATDPHTRSDQLNVGDTKICKKKKK